MLYILFFTISIFVLGFILGFDLGEKYNDNR